MNYTKFEKRDKNKKRQKHKYKRKFIKRKIRLDMKILQNNDIGKFINPEGEDKPPIYGRVFLKMMKFM